MLAAAAAAAAGVATAAETNYCRECGGDNLHGLQDEYESSSYNSALAKPRLILLLRELDLYNVGLAINSQEYSGKVQDALHSQWNHCGLPDPKHFSGLEQTVTNTHNP